MNTSGTSARARTIIAVVLIIAAALAAYGNTLLNGFVYDDYFVVSGNTAIRYLENLPKIFSQKYFSAFGEKTYRPVSTVTYMKDYLLWRSHPAGYHLTNLFLHVANALLLYVLALNLFGKKGLSLSCALLFAVHPVNSETVNAIAFREDLLVLFFALFSFISYVRISSSPPRRNLYRAACPVFFFLALFSKETAMIIPAFFLLYELFFNRPFLKAVRKNAALYSILFAILAFYVFIRFVLLRYHEKLTPDILPFYPRMLTMARVFFLYLKLFIFPRTLSAEYIYPASSSIREPAVFAAAAAIIAILVLGAARAKKFPRFFFALWWFILTLVPVANIIPAYNLVAERYLYMGASAFCLMLSVAGESLRSRLSHRARPIVPAMLILLLAAYSLRSAVRNRDWKDGLTLCRVTLETAPGSARFHNNLGVIYNEKGMHEDAVKEYLAAIELDPLHYKSYHNLGFTYSTMGFDDRAAEAYRAALRINPGFAETHNNLGTTLQGLGEMEAAEKEFRTALEIDPDFVEAHNNLGTLYFKQELYDKALEQYLRTLAIDPRNYNARCNVGLVYEKKNMTEEALTHYREMLRVYPADGGARLRLGKLYENRGLFDEAEREYRSALEAAPESAEAHNNLGFLYQRRGLTGRAIEEYREVLRIDEKNVDAHNNLGVIYANEGKFAEARRHWEAALALDPELKETRNNLELLSSQGH